MQNVLFDPGYSSCLLGVSESTEFVYMAFRDSFMPLKQKKFQFSILFPKIKAMFNKNVAFYLGCLLWASYIKTIKDGVIEDNPCLNGEYDEPSATEEVSFLIEFAQNLLNKDAKYYINKTYEADSKHIKILENYLEFIKLNKGFTQIQKTEEIELPKGIKGLTSKSSKVVKEKIDEAIQKKDLLLLFDVYDLILD